MNLFEQLRTGVIGSLAGLSVVGCVSLSPQAVARLVQPIDVALTTPASELRSRAEAGDAQAQLAWSVALRRARGGMGADPAASQHWRNRATAARGFTPITLYVAGYKGHPSRVSTTLIPRYDVSGLQAAAVGACVELLAARPAASTLASALDKGVCGGRANYERLAGLWLKAASSAPELSSR